MSETPKQRRIRLRWLTLAEIVAILAVGISGLGLWKSWQDNEPKAVVAEGARSIPLTLRAAADDDRHSVVLTAVEPGHALQSAQISFPAALGIATVEQSGDVELSAASFDDALFDGRDAGKLPKLTKREARLPLLIVTRYIEAGSPREDRALYTLGYRISDGGILSGRELSLGGLSLVTRGKGANQAALDRRWAGQAR
jgi:hypothetical protein